MTNKKARKFYESRYPIGNLFDELINCINNIPVENNSKISTQELLNLVIASKPLAVKSGMIPRYDIFYTVWKYVLIRLDKPLKTQSELLFLWKTKWKVIIPLYNYSGLQ